MPTYKNTVFKKPPEEFIKHSLERAGIQAFWRASAFDWIRLTLSGNRHFVTDIISVTIKSSNLGYCRSFQAEVLVRFPDVKGKLQTQSALITYTFDSRMHKTEIKYSGEVKPVIGYPVTLP